MDHCKNGQTPVKVLPKNPLITPAGLGIEDQNTTLLECALGAGDPEIVETIKPCFRQFKGGEEKMEHQLARYRPCIETIRTQEPYDLTRFVHVLLRSHLDDVTAELKTGKDYDGDYCSPRRNGLQKGSDLRDALNKVRNDLKPGTLTAPRMHCNYQTLTHALEILKLEWENLRVGNTWDWIHLFWRQIIGTIELQTFPAYERAAFSQGRVEEIGNGKSLDDRSTKYKYGEGKFPSWNSAFVGFHSGLGFDFAVDSGGKGLGRIRWGFGFRRMGAFSKFMSSKSFKLAELVAGLMNPVPKSESGSEWRMIF